MSFVQRGIDILILSRQELQLEASVNTVINYSIRLQIFHMNKGRQGHVAVVVGTDVYLMGGFDGSERLNDMWKSSDCGNLL